MAEPLKLTFGIELEFVLRFNLADYANKIGTIDCDDEDEDEGLGEYARQDLFFALAREGFPMNWVRDSDDWKKHNADGPPMTYGQVREFKTWKVEMDSSIMADGPLSGPQGVRYGYVGIELKSPALPYTTKSLEKIRRMCRHLGKFDILIYGSCGFHVHVGNKRKGFPLETMKNLCILTATFERELESIHPAHRIRNFYARSIGSMFHNGISLPGIRRMIRNAETVGDLIQLVQKEGKFRAYNLLNLRPSTAKKTFEFRQHEATIDADAITRWVELTCGLVQKAHRFAVQDRLNVGEMDAYIDRMNSIPQLSIIEIAKSLGLEGVASYYEGRGLHTHPSAPRSTAGSNNERTMTPSVRSENAMMPWMRPGNAVSLDRQQTVRTFMTSNGSRQRYEEEVGGSSSLICKDLVKRPRPVSAPAMSSYTVLSSPTRKALPAVSFNPRTATLAARSRGISAVPLLLMYALGYIPKLGSLSRAVTPTRSALAIAPKSRKTWTASTSDW